MHYLTTRYGNISVSYLDSLEGGGAGFGQDYIPVVRQLFGKVDRVFEFCAGPGFIGFSLLANGLCNSLCLSDINPDAVAAARDTVKRHGLQDVVSIYESDGLAQIPETEKWSLVVSNPPHFKDQYEDSIRHFDDDWKIHQRFYSGLKRHMQPDGVVLLQENFEGSDAREFVEMIRSGGLEYDGAFMWADSARRDYLDSYYFVAARPQGSQHLPIDCDGPNEIDCATPPTIVDVELPASGAPTKLRLAPFQRVRFRIHNKLDRKVVLWAFKFKYSFVPRFLRTLAVVPAAPTDLLTPFHFYPGRYALKDAATRRTLVHIDV
jgi:predicted RNA methylase